MDLGLAGEDETPAWLTAVVTAVAYGVLLTGLFLALFVVPYLAFRAF